MITVTEKGMLKRSLVGDVPFASSQSFNLCKVNAGDHLLCVLVSQSEAMDLMLVTRNGMGIRFGQDDLRPMGLVAAGVNGIKFKGEDEVVGASLVTEKDSCCFVLNDWSLGQIAVSDFPKQGRYGQGVIALRLKDNTRVVGFFTMSSNNALLYVRFGAGRFRALKPSAAKTGRRARSLEPVTQNLLHEATGVTWLPMDQAQGDEEKKEPEKPKETKKAEKPAEKAPEENEGASPEQASLF